MKKFFYKFFKFAGDAFLTSYTEKLRKKDWFIAPLTSSFFGSITDTFLFFSISFYSTGIPWVSLALGDFAAKLFITLIMLIPFRLLLHKIKDYTENSDSKVKF